MRLNVHCRRWGWLFSDFMARYANPGLWPPGVEVVTSEVALLPHKCDGWMAIRTSELRGAAEPHRSIVQVHDMDGHDLSPAAGYVFTHPDQEGQCATQDRPSMCRPIGADRRFEPRAEPPERFTVGWVGRDTGPNKNTALLVEAVKLMDPKPKVLLVGSQLERTRDALVEFTDVELINRRPHQPFDLGLYQDAYDRMSVLAITSLSEAGPMCLFEAIACGVPVVSTNCGWASAHGHLEAIRMTQFNNPLIFSQHLAGMNGRRVGLRIPTLDSWITQTLEFARETLS